MFDLLIKGGTVVDGSGAPGFPGDVGVTGGKIAVLASGLPAEAGQVIDARGRVVAPGFIDLHSHSDFNYFVDRTADSKVTQGVTTELVGNCGLSYCGPLNADNREDLDTRVAWYKTAWKPNWTSFDGYLTAAEKHGATVNLATQVGHGTVRRAVMGLTTRAPSAEELGRMKALVGEALDAGALGFSTGLSMPPGYYSLTPEVIALAQEAGARGRVYSTHARDSGDEGFGLFVALEEAIEIGRRTGARVQYSHIKCNGSTRGRSQEVIDRIGDAQKEGVDIAADVYPYVAASGPMSGNIFPRWASEGGHPRAVERMKDADLRAKARNDLDVRVAGIGGPEKIMVASYPPIPRYEGKTVPEIAADMGCDNAEALVRIFERYDVTLILSGMAEKDVDRYHATSFVAVGSDGTALKSTGPLSAGSPHPRSYGTFPRFFADAVRKKRLVTVEEAVRKMTSLPAQRLGLTKRGRLLPGSFADVVVFDPGTIADRATFASPHEYSVGVDHVLVNGKVVVKDGKPTGEVPGRVLRKPDA